MLATAPAQGPSNHNLDDFFDKVVLPPGRDTLRFKRYEFFRRDLVRLAYQRNALKVNHLKHRRIKRPPSRFKQGYLPDLVSIIRSYPHFVSVLDI